MQEFVQWSLDAIRAKGATYSWIEEIRFEWATPTAKTLSSILEGKTVIIIVDEEREWFKEYILSNINNNFLQRPLVSVVSIDDICRKFKNVSLVSELDMIEDMINMAFNDEYIYWYIGRGDDKKADLPKRKSDSYLWIFDEDYQNSFRLNSYDKDVDIKLLQLYKIFDESLSCAIFGEVDVSI